MRDVPKHRLWQCLEDAAYLADELEEKHGVRLPDQAVMQLAAMLYSQRMPRANGAWSLPDSEGRGFY